MRTSWEFGRTSAKWALDVNLPRFGRGTNWLGVPQGQRARQPTVSAQRLTNPRERFCFCLFGQKRGRKRQALPGPAHYLSTIGFSNRGKYGIGSRLAAARPLAAWVSSKNNKRRLPSGVSARTQCQSPLV